MSDAFAPTHMLPSQLRNQNHTNVNTVTFYLAALNEQVVPPAAAVVIPAYNRETFVDRAIESVLDQTITEFELIVVDDASTDGTVAEIESFTDDRLTFIQFDENRGANAARNAGVKSATAPIITFLDSDDEYDRTFLEAVCATLSGTPTSVGGVYTSRRRVQEGVEVDLDVADTVYRNPKAVVHDYQAYGFSNWALRRDVFDDVGYLDESLRGMQDREFMIRLLRQYEFHPIEECLATQYKHAEQMSADPGRKLDALDQLVEKHSGLFTGATLGWLDYQRGWLYARSGDLATGRQFFWRALRRHPQATKIQIQAIASLFGRRGFHTINELKQRAKHTVLKLR